MVAGVGAEFHFLSYSYLGECVLVTSLRLVISEPKSRDMVREEVTNIKTTVIMSIK